MSNTFSSNDHSLSSANGEDYYSEYIGSQTSCKRIKTVHTKETKTIDMNKISSTNDLKSVRKDDPFMYFSIPQVRRAEMLLKDVDTVSLGVRSSASSRPSRLMKKPLSASPHKVTRKSRISFETDLFNLIVEGGLMEEEEEVDEEL